MALGINFEDEHCISSEILYEDEIADEDLPEEGSFLDCDVTDQSINQHLSPGVIAPQVNRDVLDLILNIDDHSTEIDSESLGRVLLGSQSLLKSLAHKDGSLTGRLPKKVEDEVRMNVTGTYAASFGVRLESDQFTKLFDGTVSAALGEFLELMEAKDDGERISQLLRGMTPRSKTSFKTFIENLVRSDTGIGVIWGRPTGVEKSVNVSKQEVRRVLDIISTTSDADSEIVDHYGRLVGINVEKGSFEFKTKDNDFIRGKLTANLAGNI